MGITIRTKVKCCDMGYGGFMRFRQHIAFLICDEVGLHYKCLGDAPWARRDEFFIKFDANTKRLIESGKLSIELAGFLFASDVDGKCDMKQVRALRDILKLSKNDDEIYGYCGRKDATTMRDMKEIFCGKYAVRWS